MTDREKAIVMAYTGSAMLCGEKFAIFHKYVEELLGRKVWTHELAEKDVWDEIKKAAKKDFVELCKDETGDNTSPVQPFGKSEQLSKLMTAEEARNYVGYCVLEYTSHHGLHYLAVHWFSEDRVQDVSSPRASTPIGEPKNELLWENYNAKWRVWRELPTWEEREGAKWNE